MVDHCYLYMVECWAKATHYTLAIYASVQKALGLKLEFPADVTACGAYKIIR